MVYYSESKQYSIEDEEYPKQGIPVLCYVNKYEACFKKDRQFIDYNIPMIGRFYETNGYKHFDCEGSYFKVVSWTYLPYYYYYNEDIK